MTAPAVILVGPQLGANIGFAARAMLNCGLSELRLVAPRDGWPNPAAEAAAAGADAVVENATVFDDVPSAIADLERIYAATARRREQIKRVLTPRAAAAAIRSENDVRAGLMFGPERSGLDNDAVALADAVIQVPLNPDFTSLSLPQAVLIAAYEWFIAGDDTASDEVVANEAAPATKDELQNFFDRLEAALDEGDFFHVAEKRPIMVRNIRNLFQRAGLMDQEVRTLQGIVSCLTRRGDKGGKG
jgi:tRNA/rRNA methyltransferase